MRTPFRVKTILLILASASATLRAADPAKSDGMSNGRAWNGLGGGDKKMAVMLKFLYVAGLSDGFQQAREETSISLVGVVSALSSSKPSADRVEKIRKTAA